MRSPVIFWMVAAILGAAATDLPVHATVDAGGRIDYHALTRDGRSLAVCLNEGRRIRILDLETATWRGELPASPEPRYVATNRDAIFVTAGGRVLVRHEADGLRATARVELPEPVAGLRAVPGSGSAPVNVVNQDGSSRAFAPVTLEEIPLLSVLPEAYHPVSLATGRWCWSSADGFLCVMQRDLSRDGAFVRCASAFQFQSASDNLPLPANGGLFATGGKVLRATDTDHGKETLWSMPETRRSNEARHLVIPAVAANRALVLSWVPAPSSEALLTGLTGQLRTLREGTILRDLGCFPELAACHEPFPEAGLALHRRVLLPASGDLLLTFDNQGRIRFRRLPPASAPRPGFVTLPSPVATRGEPWTFDLRAEGGTPPYRFGLDKAPAGATIDGTTLHWTPPADFLPGTISFTLLLEDAAGGTSRIPVKLTVSGRRPAVAHPYLHSREVLADAAKETVNPWRKGVPYRLLPLADPVAMAIGLAGNQVIAVVAADHRTLRFIDLRTETVRRELRETEEIGSLHGGGSQLLAYLPASRVLRRRVLATLDEPLDWKPAAGNVAGAVGVGRRTSGILVLDQAYRLHPLDGRTMRERGEPVEVRRLLGTDRHLPPVDGPTPGLRRLTVSEDLSHVYFAGFRIELGPRPKAVVTGRISHQMRDIPVVANGSEWFALPDAVFDRAGTLRARIPGRPLAIPGDVGLAVAAHGSANRQLRILDGRSLTGALTLTGLAEFGGGPVGIEPMPLEQRVFFCPSLKKLAIFDGRRENLYIRDLDLGALMAAFPRQSSPPLVRPGPDAAVRYNFAFRPQPMIRGYRLRTGPPGVRIDVRSGFCSWARSDTASPGRAEVVVDALLKGGGTASGWVTIEWAEDP